MDTLSHITPERFAEGLTIDEFVQGMGRNREVFRQNYNDFSVKPGDVDFFANRSAVSKVLVLAEDWCGDVLRYVPAVARLAEAVPGWEVRVFYRDQNLDLADNWKKQGQFRAIPVIVFFDEMWRELACFVEKPSNIYSEETAAHEAFAAEHPDLEDANLTSDKMSGATLDLYATFIRQYRADSLRRWQQRFVDEIKSKLGA